MYNLVHKLRLTSQLQSRRHQSDSDELRSSAAMATTAKPISSPVPIHYYPTLAMLLLTVGLIVTASFFIYEATAPRRSRSLLKEVTTGAIASFFLGFGTLFLLLATGVYV